MLFRIDRVVVLLTLIGGIATTPAGAQSSAARWPLALTFDDLPMAGGAGCSAVEITTVTDALLGALRSASAPAAGFVVPGTPCQATGNASALAVAERWLADGHRLGNHSYTHRDYNGLSAAEYLEDIARADRALEPLLSGRQSERWYRPPLLHTGPDETRRTALTAWLARHRQIMGVVTIDNQEWVYASAYARARTAGRTDLMAEIAGAYLGHLAEATGYSRHLSRTLFGRDIAQILLLHANRLNADLLPRVLTMYRDLGADFIPIEQAAADSAYQTPDRYVGPQGLSWLRRWALAQGVVPPAEPREEPWIAAYASSGQLPVTAVSAAVAAELDSANAAFSRAWVAGDVETVLRAYPSHAVVHPPAGGVLTSTEAIRNYWQGIRRVARAGHRIETTLRRPIAPGRVLEMGRWHSSVRGTDGNAPWNSGCYTVVWERGETDGVWRMAYDGWSAPNPNEWACRPR